KRVGRAFLVPVLRSPYTFFLHVVVPPRRSFTQYIGDALPRLLAEASKAPHTRASWHAATDILREWAGCARVQLTYKGLNESGTLEAGAPGQEGETFLTDYHDAEGRHVSARFEGLPTGVPGDVLRSSIEVATHLAVMVARRSGLERERRLGTFLV